MQRQYIKTQSHTFKKETVFQGKGNNSVIFIYFSDLVLQCFFQCTHTYFIPCFLQVIQRTELVLSGKSISSDLKLFFLFAISVSLVF